MSLLRIKLLFVTLFVMLFLPACSVSKLEARLEANPQCKDIINPKTGALMPCPETDKAFYRSVGLEPQKLPPKPVASQATAVTTASAAVSVAPASTNAVANVSTDCKPQLHKKTGVLMPCPAPE